MKLFTKLYQSLWTKNSFENEQHEEKTENEYVGYITEKPALQHTLQAFENCSDFTHRHLPHLKIDLLFFQNLVGNDELVRELLDPLRSIQPNEIVTFLQESQFVQSEDSKEVIVGVLSGKAAVFYHEKVYLVDIASPTERQIDQSEQETVITGPHDSFNEAIDTNISLIRKRIKSSHLKTIELSVGEVTKTKVILLYIEDIANIELVNKLKSRIEAIETASVFDSNMLVQQIEESPLSIFPQFLTSERPDGTCNKLVSGRIVGFVDGSPFAFAAPTSFFEFFSSPDDYYQRWPIGSFIRLLRIIAFIVTIGFTAFYVSVTTFHYEMIPDTLLIPLAESRSKVPFPPIYEALIMEITIELLREAGARLPTKIGQTIGIVGGIVIGQAAVEAGFTSNILIISVAISAIASFVIPSYLMSASIRLIRFGLIILAGILGNFGLLVGVALITIHLSGVTNLGTSYLTPIAPLNLKDWKDTFIRAPFFMFRERPSISKSPNKVYNRMKK
ncbi:spore germination protein [Bacillus timonensis]|nr:spore germination protein [Bacillus timonensis]